MIESLKPSSNQRYLVSASGSMDITGSRILNRLVTEERDGCQGKTCGTLAKEFSSAGISAGGRILATAEGTLTNLGSRIAAQARVQIDAKQGITNESLSTQFVTKDVTKRKWYGKKNRILEHGVDMSVASIVSTQDSVVLESDGDLNNIGAQITALGTIQGTIKGDINLTSLVEEVHNVYQKCNGLIILEGFIAYN